MKPAVLVVDDEPSIAEGLRLIREREGYFVEIRVIHSGAHQGG